MYKDLEGLLRGPRCEGATVYVIGTGPSLRLFDPDFLDRLGTGNKITLNGAWRYAQNGIGLTIHPRYVYEARQSGRRPFLWVTKPKTETWADETGETITFTADEKTTEDGECCWFQSSGAWKVFHDRPKNTLFVGRGIHQTAVHLACLLGAAVVVLVGVDMNDLGGDDHADNQDTQYHGLSKKAVFQEYRDWMSQCRKEVWKKFKVPILSLSPLLGSNADEEEYARLKELLNLDKLPKPRDVSRYTRCSTDTVDAGDPTT